MPQPETASVVLVRPPTGMTPIGRPRVLLVDDNETILKRDTATLARVYEIVGAVKDGAAALDAVRLLRPDVVVLDISMPSMSGLVGGPSRCSHDAQRTGVGGGGAGGRRHRLRAQARLSSDLTIAIAEALEGRR